MSKKPWDGRFSGATDKGVETFTSSIDIDRRLFKHDIDGSIAHCRMLARTGIITKKESESLVQGLKKIKTEIENGKFTFTDSLEDIHMHIEDRLSKVSGGVAQKLHTARSRNDQVALDVRMYLRDEVKEILSALIALRTVIVRMAKKHLDTIFPGYTHVQRAQPVLFSHHLMAYYEMFTRDAERFSDGLKRIDVMPLGSGAVAGTTYPIDRKYTAKLLKFPKVSANSIDSVSDRDFIIEFLAAAGICMVHLSRMSEELVLWSSSEFNFIELPDAFATGSSMMPQKKNPDVPELVRGKTGSVFGSLMAVLTVMKSLPLSYNRDMQEDKEPLFNTIDTLKACITITANMLPGINIKKDMMRRACLTGYLNATDFADYLVSKGMPFRKAHACAGKAVAYGIQKNKELHEMTLKELTKFSKLVEKDVSAILTPEQMVGRRTSAGGTAVKNVKSAIKKAETRLKNERTKIG